MRSEEQTTPVQAVRAADAHSLRLQGFVGQAILSLVWKNDRVMVMTVAKHALCALSVPDHYLPTRRHLQSRK